MNPTLDPNLKYKHQEAHVILYLDNFNTLQQLLKTSREIIGLTSETLNINIGTRKTSVDFGFSLC